MEKLVTAWNKRSRARKEAADAAKTRAPQPAVTVDYPRSEEAINPAAYTIRVGAPEGSKPEVSIDGGPWLPCRFASGYWWYDWSGYLSGEHRLIARIKTKDGQTALSPYRAFTTVQKKAGAN